jgi:glyoxylase-like metal-dependent hydrolase (beta-lactamase superfamily II)
VFDLDTDQQKPYAVLTGDTLFVGDVGRPDLRASLGWSATELGRHLYHSLGTKLMTLPETTLVDPVHGAGSAWIQEPSGIGRRSRRLGGGEAAARRRSTVGQSAIVQATSDSRLTT